MHRRMPVLLLASWLTAPGLALAQEELTPEKIARIRRDEQEAQRKVDAAYGNRKPSEMSNEERRQAAREQQEAAMKVMEKHGVSDKEYSRHMARMGREEREAVELAEKKLEAEAKAAKQAREEEGKKTQEPGEIPIQKGISENNPVELEASTDAASVVEQGLPPGEASAEGGSEAQ